MSYLLPHLSTGWAVDQAILNEEDRVVVVRFGHDYGDRHHAATAAAAAATKRTRPPHHQRPRTTNATTHLHRCRLHGDGRGFV